MPDCGRIDKCLFYRNRLAPIADPTPAQGQNIQYFRLETPQHGSQVMAIDWLQAGHVRNARQAVLMLNVRLWNLPEWRGG